MNSGSAVSDQPVVALHDEVPSSRPILPLSISDKPMMARPVRVSATQIPLVSINSMHTTRMLPTSVISMVYSTPLLLSSSSFSTYCGVWPVSIRRKLSSMAMNRNRDPSAIGVCTIHSGTTR